MGNALSLDLARHLPCRLQAGRILVVADNPRIFSSVLCRRWTAILKEVELQICLTMDRNKKQLLRSELHRLQNVQISSKDTSSTKVLVVASNSLPLLQLSAATIYLTAPTNGHAQSILNIIQPRGLIVVYHEQWDDFNEAVRQHVRLP